MRNPGAEMMRAGFVLLVVMGAIMLVNTEGSVEDKWMETKEPTVNEEHAKVWWTWKHS